jgi:hypothetical protein
MTENLCRCGKPTRDAAYVCEPCGDDLARALGDVAWLVDELEISVTRQKGVDYRQAGGGSGPKKPSERPSPVQWGAAEARAELRSILVLWTRLCAEENVRNSSPYPGLPDDDLAAISRWLMWRVDGLTLHEAGADAVDEITSAVAHCHRVIDRPADQEFAGPCECGRDLYRKPKAPEVKCRQCEKVYKVDELAEWMRAQMVGKLVTIREGSLLLGKLGLSTPIRTLQHWGEQKWILAHGSSPKGGNLYLFDDLIDRAVKRSA